MDKLEKKIDANNAKTKAKLDQILNKIGSISQFPIRLTNEISTEKIQNQQNTDTKGKISF